MRSNLLLFFFAYLFLAGGASAEGVTDLAGHWRTVRHGALVKIDDCGNGTPCGELAWVRARCVNMEPLDGVKSGLSARCGDNLLDVRNPDSRRHGQKLVGAPILWGFSPNEDGWRDGHLYNPEDGKTFRAHLQQLSHTELRVTGCLGPFCRSQIWTRSDDPRETR